ncbi:glycerophosphoryl diester phosphodiesterase [Thalassobacillus pellis]|nr:glycerophosphodiester phosphodiesterase [Thalassobacillus pellis]MBM7552378.1 glycerophosphoryl diester phosphodiesterase [Thalassobacillus pellis]
MGTLIYAHRGASKLAPENTMPAFELAYHAGADGIETDVQLTKDRVPILIHDENLRRTTNGTGFVQDYTYDEIKRLDAGSWLSSKFSDTPIVSLEEFLSWVQDKSMYLNIELKTKVIAYKDIEQKVYELLCHFGLVEKTVISSFNSDSIKRMQAVAPEIATAFLTSQNIKDLPSFAKQLGVSALHTKYRLLNQKLVDNCRKEGIDLRIYTVNKASPLKKCYKLQCDGIFTDVPHLAIEYRKVCQ